ncbi:MAG: hypothetical protein O7C60_05075 [Rickettsia endosymbiont of Ixodes persulcatus]|nr:hypothetical protein [Rickettsia endosymbiont of Ixodes persulcatus]MCZ6919653.1 hypothetical protein [Rickettsia endosymbiont of Ixodes persulcatus]
MIWHYSEIYFIGDVGWTPAKALMLECRSDVRKIEPLPKIMELWPEPFCYNWLKENTECNNPNIDPKVMENIVSLCVERLVWI